MTTREVAAEYRLAHWTGVIKQRTATGQSIRAFCETEGIHENTYYYWQRKLREAAIEGIQPSLMKGKYETGVPSGWAICTISGDEKPAERTIYIEIGKCRIKATMDTDMELMTKICKALVSIC